MEDIEARLGSHAPKDSPLGQSLTELMRADPGFDPGQFLDGAKVGLRDDRHGVRRRRRGLAEQLLGTDVFEGFERAIRERETRGEKVESSLVGIDKADIIESEVKNRTAYVTVKFVSELISVTRDADGEVVEGDPKKVREVTDIWTFAREIASQEPELEAGRDRSRQLTDSSGTASIYRAIAGALLLAAIAVTIALTCCCGKRAWKSTTHQPHAGQLRRHRRLGRGRPRRCLCRSAAILRAGSPTRILEACAAAKALAR